MGGFAIKSGDVAQSKCLTCAVRSRAFCHIATGQAFAELARISTVKTFKAGETIIEQHGRSHVVGNVVSGALKLVKYLSDGRAHIVELLFPSDFYGRVFSASAEFSLEAASDVQLCMIDRVAFENLMATYPEIKHELYVASLGQVDRARERIMLHACQSTLERLTSYLALRLLQNELADEAPGENKMVVVAMLNRRDLAGYLGTTVETISRNVQYLARSGVIRICENGDFEIVKRQVLFNLSGQSQEDLSAIVDAGRPRTRPAVSTAKLNVAQRLTAPAPTRRLEVIRTVTNSAVDIVAARRETIAVAVVK